MVPIPEIFFFSLEFFQFLFYIFSSHRMRCIKILNHFIFLMHLTFLLMNLLIKMALFTFTGAFDLKVGFVGYKYTYNGFLWLTINGVSISFLFLSTFKTCLLHRILFMFHFHSRSNIPLTSLEHSICLYLI